MFRRSSVTTMNIFLKNIVLWRGCGWCLGKIPHQSSSIIIIRIIIMMISICLREGTYFLFYSASLFQLPSYHVRLPSSSYSSLPSCLSVPSSLLSSQTYRHYDQVGVARSSHLMGPYTKSDTPVVQTDWERWPVLSLTSLLIYHHHDDAGTMLVKTAPLKVTIIESTHQWTISRIFDVEFFQKCKSHGTQVPT